MAGLLHMLCAREDRRLALFTNSSVSFTIGYTQRLILEVYGNLLIFSVLKLDGHDRKYTYMTVGICIGLGRMYGRWFPQPILIASRGVRWYPHVENRR